MRALNYAKETACIKTLIMELLSDKGKVMQGRRLVPSSRATLNVCFQAAVLLLDQFSSDEQW